MRSDHSNLTASAFNRWALPSSPSIRYAARQASRSIAQEEASISPPVTSSGAPGPAEYILVKAGLFDVVDLAVSPTDRLTRVLRPLNPLPDELLPILVRMAKCAALELGGAIDTGALRSRLVGELHKLGLRHEQIGDLFVRVGKGAELAAEERRKEPRVEDSYM